MGCQLGRITGLWSPNTIRQDGDELRVSGEFVLPSGYDGVSLAQQVVGYPNPDEPVVPFIYDASLSNGVLDGFYTVISAEVDWAKLASGLFSWSAVLHRVPGYQAPLFEVLLGGDIRDNDHGIILGGGSTARSWVGLPPEADLLGGYVHLIEPTVPSKSIEEIADPGEQHTNLLLHDSTTPDILMSGSVLYAAAAGDYYHGAARIETTPDYGATWDVVTGRQIPNRPTGWRIRNDLIRCTPFGSVLVFEGYLGGWESKAFNVTTDGASSNPLGAIQSVSILRNTPERCTIRLWASGDLFWQTSTVDITVSRSAWWLDCVATNIGGGGEENFGVFVTTPEAGTSSTPGLQATGNDANGNRYQLWSPVTNTKDAVNGGIYATSVGFTFPFAVSYNTLQDSTVETVDAYFAAQAHRQRIVVR